MKKYIFITIFLFSLTFIQPKAYTNEQVYDAVFTDLTWSQSKVVSMINDVDNRYPNLWQNNYYIIYLWNYSPGQIMTQWLFVDKTTGKLQILNIDGNGKSTLTYTNQVNLMYWMNGTFFQASTSNGTLKVENNDATKYDSDSLFTGDQGIILYANLPIIYVDNNGNNTYLADREIPWEWFPIGHYMHVEPVSTNNTDNLDNKNSPSLYFSSILSNFDFDSFYLKLTDVVDLLFSKFQDTFNSVISVFDYITNSFTSINSFISSNAGIVSLISLSYLALPSILRNIFILGLSSSVVFIMLRRAM